MLKREDYDKLSLPDFGLVDRLFEINSIEPTGFPLRDIRRHIADKIKGFAEILEEVLHPNSTVSAYHEYKFFGEDEKAAVAGIYAKLMQHLRDSSVLDLLADDGKDAEYIRRVAGEWPALRDQLLPILTRLRDCWSKEDAEAPASTYFG